jgi:hypothetical protein
MIKYIDDYKTVRLEDNSQVFENGCFNCKNLAKKHSTINGRCSFLPPDSLVWKDFTCEKHDPIVLIPPK